MSCSEKDVDEVLQATTVFSNVSKGTLAKHEDLVDVFGTEDEEKICLMILAEGDLQVKPKLIGRHPTTTPAKSYASCSRLYASLPLYKARQPKFTAVTSNPTTQSRML